MLLNQVKVLLDPVSFGSLQLSLVIRGYTKIYRDLRVLREFAVHFGDGFAGGFTRLEYAEFGYASDGFRFSRPFGSGSLYFEDREELSCK